MAKYSDRSSVILLCCMPTTCSASFFLSWYCFSAPMTVYSADQTFYWKSFIWFSDGTSFLSSFISVWSIKISISKLFFVFFCFKKSALRISSMKLSWEWNICWSFKDACEWMQFSDKTSKLFSNPAFSKTSLLIGLLDSD